MDILKKKRQKTVVIPEGRPQLEAAKVNSRELLKRNMTPLVIADNMAGFMFYRNMIKEVWLAYQIGDAHGALCDIGALIYAVLAKKHRVPVLAYPAVEQKRFIGKPKEICCFCGRRVAPPAVKGYVPLLEWVPGNYIGKIHE